MIKRTIEEMGSIANCPPIGDPMQYDPAFKVEVCLKQPLWERASSRNDICIKATAVCAQIDLLCRKELSQQSNGRIDNGKVSTSFEGKAMILLDQFHTLLKKLPGPQPSGIDFMDFAGLTKLYPRAAAYIHRPTELSIASKQTPMDSYFTKLAGLQQLVTMAHQINSDITNLPNHKYIAHQTALLYQCLVTHSENETLADIKDNIEENFKDLKQSLIEKDENEIPCLSQEYTQWLLEITSSIVNTVTSYPTELTKPMVLPGNTVTKFK